MHALDMSTLTDQLLATETVFMHSFYLLLVQIKLLIFRYKVQQHYNDSSSFVHAILHNAS
jgi:hypothetical protein